MGLSTVIQTENWKKKGLIYNNFYVLKNLWLSVWNITIFRAWAQRHDSQNWVLKNKDQFHRKLLSATNCKSKLPLSSWEIITTPKQLKKMNLSFQFLRSNHYSKIDPHLLAYFLFCFQSSQVKLLMKSQCPYRCKKSVISAQVVGNLNTVKMEISEKMFWRYRVGIKVLLALSHPSFPLICQCRICTPWSQR